MKNKHIAQSVKQQIKEITKTEGFVKFMESFIEKIVITAHSSANIIGAGAVWIASHFSIISPILGFLILFTQLIVGFYTLKIKKVEYKKLTKEINQ